MVHEDVKMKMFMLSLNLWNNNIDKRYDGIPKKGICSLEEFIKVFCKRQDPYFKGDIGYIID